MWLACGSTPTAKRLKLGDYALVSQETTAVVLPVIEDERIAPDMGWVANALPQTVGLGHSFAPISIQPTTPEDR